jgi:protein-S-isoprenylcysteine O-methyltransferase Ste14
MKYIALIVWMLLSVILVCSVVGLLLFIPQINYTDYYISQEESRSTWMRIGFKLLNNL